MTTRPPSRGGSGRKGAGKGAGNGAGAGRGAPPGRPGRPGKPGAFKRPDRARTGPRTSALDAAQRAAQARGDAAAKHAPWRPGQEARDRETGPQDGYGQDGSGQDGYGQDGFDNVDEAPRRAPRSRAARPAPAGAAPRRPGARETAPVPEGPTRREQRAAASATLASGVQTLTVEEDEAGMRIDRFLTTRSPSFPSPASRASCARASSGSTASAPSPTTGSSRA